MPSDETVVAWEGLHFTTVSMVSFLIQHTEKMHGKATKGAGSTGNHFLLLKKPYGDSSPDL